MNKVFFSGYLPADADRRVTPAGDVKLMFDVRLMDGRGVESTQKCVLDEAPLVREYEALLTPGRAVFAEGELTAHAWVEHGRTKAYIREVRVLRMEFPNRSAAQAKEEVA